MKTEKEKAEAYVREKLSELRRPQPCVYHLMEAGGQCDHEEEELYPIIQLQHWLRAVRIATKQEWIISTTGALRDKRNVPFMVFDLTTGQPDGEENYKAFNEIVGNT